MAQNQSNIQKYNNGYTVNKNKNIIGLLDIERIEANPLYKCTISGSSSVYNQKVKSFMPSSISGIYDTDSNFTLSLGSEYSDTFEMPDIVNDINSITGFAANYFGRTQFILKSVRMTEQRWTGSSAPTFNISINIPIVRKPEAAWNVLKFISQALSGTINNYAGGGQTKSTESAYVIYAPNGYTIHYKDSKQDSDYPTGTYTIELGSGTSCWFRMPNALITNASFSISNKKYYDGNPVSVKVNISFKWWRQPLLEDIIEWFPKAY